MRITSTSALVFHFLIFTILALTFIRFLEYNGSFAIIEYTLNKFQKYNLDLFIFLQTILVIGVTIALIRFIRKGKYIDHITGVRWFYGIWLFSILMLPTLYFVMKHTRYTGYFLDNSVFVFFNCITTLSAITASVLLFKFKSAQRKKLFTKIGPAIVPTNDYLLFFAFAGVLITGFLRILMSYTPSFKDGINGYFYFLQEGTSVSLFQLGENIECNSTNSCITNNLYILPLQFIFYFSFLYTTLLYLIEVKLFNSFVERKSDALMLQDGTLYKFFSYFSAAIALIFALLMVGASPVGVGLFSGLIGAGLSFVFREIFNNFAAGLIISLDKSISKNDFILLKDGTAGTITSMNFRYCTVINRDYVEYLIPNTKFLSEIIETYSKSDTEVRLRQEFLISNTLPFKDIMDHVEGTFNKLPKRILRGGFTQPKIFYKGMENLGHRFELRFWINDPQSGIGNIKNDVMVYVHECLEREFTRKKLGLKFTISSQPTVNNFSKWGINKK